MSAHLFTSADAGATTITGAAGGLVGVLDAILVNGYNSVGITSINRSGTTATVVTSAAHGFVASAPSSGRRAKMAGLDQAAYNGDFEITVLSTTSFSYQVTGSPATPATGSGTVCRAPLGWSIAFTGTNKRAYRAPTGNRFYYRFDDSVTSQARFVGYESMTDVDTGVNAFPTATQLSGGMYFAKSATSDSTARNWYAVGDDKRLFIMSIPNGANSGVPHFIGDFKNFNSADLYGSMVAGVWTATSAPAASAMFNSRSPSTSQGITATGAITRNINQFTTGIYATMVWGWLGISLLGSGFCSGGTNDTTFAFPDYHGALLIAKVFVCEVANGNANDRTRIRGSMPGIWFPNHARTSFADGQYITGTGDQAGKTFMAWFTANSGWMLVETSDTWDV